MGMFVVTNKENTCKWCGYLFRYEFRGQTEYCCCCYEEAALRDEW